MFTWYIYKDPKGEWRWRRVAKNGAAMASRCGFKDREGCLADARSRGFIGR